MENITVHLVTRHLVHLAPEVPLEQVPELVEYALKHWETTGRVLGVDVRGEGDFWKVWIVKAGVE